MFRWLPGITLAATLATLSLISLPPAASAQTHPRCGDAVRVQPGNTLNQIAQYCGTTIGALMAANPQIINPNVIHVGQVIHMPGRVAAERPRPPAVQPSPPAAIGPCGTRVIVRPGDTLFRIAMRCDTTVGALLRANPQIEGPGQIRLGQVIRMPGAPMPQPSPPDATGPCGARVVVQPGDTLFRIAMRCDTSVSALLRANPHIEGPGQIRVGQVIRMPGVVAPQPPRAEPPRTPPTQPWRPPYFPTELRFTGTVTNEGIECPAVRGDDGRLYTLTGDFGRVRPGDRVQVTGRQPQVSICMQGTTVEVRQLVRLDQPVAPPDRIDLTGTLTWEGVTCPAMRGDDGRLYTLAGDIGGFEPGDRVQVLGRRAEVSICMQGTTIELQRIRPAR